MLRLEEALERVLSAVRLMPEEEVPLSEAHGRILAVDVTSKIAIPPWDNSAMDGFAVCASDLATAPVQLTVLETIAAGTVGTQRVQPGSCSRIMTGAPMPMGADAVVMVEQTAMVESGRVEIQAPARSGQNVRYQGNDVPIGRIVLKAGRRLDPPAVGLLSSVGLATVSVRKQPVVAILSTGDEVIAAGEPLGPGQIYSSNTHSLMGMVLEAGGRPVDCGNAPDDPEALKSFLKKCLIGDIIVTTGGVSVGDFDFVKEAYAAFGSELDFWKVCIKPGKPLAYGQIGGKPAFGLPGNPVSCMVNFTQFVRPFLQGMLGVGRSFSPVVDAVLDAPIKKRPGRALLCRVSLRFEAGKIVAQPFDNQSSGALTSMVSSDGLALFNVEAAGAEKGEIVRVQVSRWDWAHGQTVNLGW
jgi:molybdopterin molybdotransferase